MPEGWDKAAWRAWARRARRDMRASGGDAVDRAVARHAVAWERFAEARVIGVYMAFGDEVDLAPLISEARISGKRLVAPRATALPEPHLTLHYLYEGARLTRHGYGQLEPPPDAPEASPTQIDILFVPGLAFDLAGNRLGYGMGYYDRLLPSLRPDVPIVGVAPTGLVVPSLPAEDHDVRVTHIITESGLSQAGSGPASSSARS